jgi:hypothetical protein
VRDLILLLSLICLDISECTYVLTSDSIFKVYIYWGLNEVSQLIQLPTMLRVVGPAVCSQLSQDFTVWALNTSTDVFALCDQYCRSTAQGSRTIWPIVFSRCVTWGPETCYFSPSIWFFIDLGNVMLRRALVFKVSRRTNCVAMTVSRVLVVKLLLDFSVLKKGLSR